VEDVRILRDIERTSSLLLQTLCQLFFSRVLLDPNRRNARQRCGVDLESNVRPLPDSFCILSPWRRRLTNDLNHTVTDVCENPTGFVLTSSPSRLVGGACSCCIVSCRE
jgi:hypothetical protein